MYDELVPALRHACRGVEFNSFHLCMSDAVPSKCHRKLVGCGFAAAVSAVHRRVTLLWEHARGLVTQQLLSRSCIQRIYVSIEARPGACTLAQAQGAQLPNHQTTKSKDVSEGKHGMQRGAPTAPTATAWLPLIAHIFMLQASCTFPPTGCGPLLLWPTSCGVQMAPARRGRQLIPAAAAAIAAAVAVTAAVTAA